MPSNEYDPTNTPRPRDLIWARKVSLTIRLVDRSPNAHERLADHTLRAQRLAWLSEGLLHPDCTLPHPAEVTDEALLQIETLGRKAAHQRFGRGKPFGEDHELLDSSVVVTEVEQGSLILCTTIIVAGGVAAYLGGIWAKGPGERRRWELRTRVLAATEEQLQNEALGNDDRRAIILRMIDRLGAGYEREIVDSLSLSVPGVGEVKLSTGVSATAEKAPANEVAESERALDQILVREDD